MFLLAGCGENKAANVMTLDVNPEVSFVLDSNNKVISVKYEDGQNGEGDAGTIYADVDFIGKDLNATIQLFVERAAISGHIDLNGEQINIEISGKDDTTVTQLKNAVKKQIENVFASLGSSVTVNFENLTATAQRTALEAKALLLAPEKTSADLEKMSNAELIQLISDKQNEYKDLAYSQVKTIVSQLESAEQVALNTAKDLFEQAEEALKSAQASLDAVSSYISGEALQVYQDAVNKAQTALNVAKTNFNETVNKFLQKKNELIQEAKKQYETIKAQLVEEYQNQVSAQKASIVSHLLEAKNQGLITEEQYNYYVDLINSQTASN